MEQFSEYIIRLYLLFHLNRLYMQIVDSKGSSNGIYWIEEFDLFFIEELSSLSFFPLKMEILVIPLCRPIILVGVSLRVHFPHYEIWEHLLGGSIKGNYQKEELKRKK